MTREKVKTGNIKGVFLIFICSVIVNANMCWYRITHNLYAEFALHPLNQVRIVLNGP